MLFNSISFLFYLPITILVNYYLPHRFRWIWLLLASCFFYMFFKPVYILILFFTILIDYIAGIKIEESRSKQAKKYWLIASIIANIGVLAFFKYYNFGVENINWIRNNVFHQQALPLMNIVLPIGLSFHTFQALSYTIEVYYGRQKAERHPGYYALYVMFFPQLVAGPIERPQNILPQLHKDQKADYTMLSDAGKWILWGFFMKLCIADRLSYFVNEVYANPGAHTSAQTWVAVLFFSFQIYCDFAAYSFIAIGSALMCGVHLMKNFDRPYASHSLSVFWTRWHISLSTWFKDYVYIPMGGNRNGFVLMCFNIAFVFILSGVWHGAGWTFVLWGALHGLFLILEHIAAKNISFFERIRSNASWLSSIVVFTIVSLLWVFFRAKNVNELKGILHNLMLGNAGGFSWDMFGKAHQLDLKLSVLFIILLELIQWLARKNDVITQVKRMPTYARFFVYFVMIVVLLLFGAYHQTSEFIYFQF